MNYKSFHLLLISTIIMILSVDLNAQSSGKCGYISDSDEENMCLAQVKQSSSYCGRIRNEDQKNLCRARVEKNSSYCGRIRDSDMKNDC
ncbi:hypothetical protein, partial [Leptospira haakeii]